MVGLLSTLNITEGKWLESNLILSLMMYKKMYVQRVYDYF